MIVEGVDPDALTQQLSKNSAWIIAISILGSEEFVSRITGVINDNAATSSKNQWRQQWGGERTAVLWKMQSRADATVSACDVAHVAKDMISNKEKIHDMWTFTCNMARDGDAPLRIGVIARGSGNVRCWSDLFETAVMDAIANGPVYILAGMFTLNAQNAKTLGSSARIVFFKPWHLPAVAGDVTRLALGKAPMNRQGRTAQDVAKEYAMEIDDLEQLTAIPHYIIVFAVFAKDANLLPN